MSESSLPARESMQYDVVIVGAGPAGLAAAIRLKQLAQAAGREIGICVLEKGAEVGAHILSGAVVDPRALNELFPDWAARGAPLTVPVREDTILLLGKQKSWQVPEGLIPLPMRNHGNYIASLGLLCRWLAKEAEALGVEIYPGFAASEVLYRADGSVEGVAIGDMGIAHDGRHKAAYTRGITLLGRYTLFAEGARGSLTRTLEERFDLRKQAQPQQYGIGLKELWEVPAEVHREGLALHTLGWPLDADTHGGGFVYHLNERQVMVGLVVHLDYHNPWLSPFEEFQRFKTHPRIRTMLAGGQRIAYGARATAEGGVQSLPQLVFPGGALLGCAAGTLNLPRIKGTHNAMKSGMLAAEAIAVALAANRSWDTLKDYPAQLRTSWLWQDLDAARNVKPVLGRLGTWGGMLYAGFDLWCHAWGLRLPWTFRHQGADHTALRAARDCPRIDYPPPDGKLTFDKSSSVYLANTQHEEDQPVHLRLTFPELAVQVNWAEYAGPEQRFCPAGVYEFLTEAGTKAELPSAERATTAGQPLPRLQINAANCVHCKTCDIKDPTQNIRWVPPEGGSGPNYPNM